MASCVLASLVARHRATQQAAPVPAKAGEALSHAA
jgi:hypothetical protein